MKVQFSVKMKPKYMYNFLISHIYKSFMGLFSILIGIASVCMAVYSYRSGTSAYILCYVVVAALALIYPPVMLWFRARQQVLMSPVFKKPSDYEIDLEGVRVTQEEETAFAAWEELYRIRSTKMSVIVYIDKRKAMIWPKECIGSRYADLEKLIRDNMPSSKVKIR